MVKNVTLNPEQALYVIPCGDGYSCFGFENARRDAEHIALALQRVDLMPTPAEFGTLVGYEKYRSACSAWSSSVLSRKTWFTPGTDKKVQRLLESYRDSRKLVRLFYGDTATGKDWCNEWDMVGVIGRSCGSQKIPLLVIPGEDGGGAILTDSIVRMMDITTNAELYRHPLYQVPNIHVEPLNDELLPEYKWQGSRDGELIARFKTAYEAAEWEEYLTGRIAAKREDLLQGMRRAA